MRPILRTANFHPRNLISKGSKGAFPAQAVTNAKRQAIEALFSRRVFNKGNMVKREPPMNIGTVELKSNPFHQDSFPKIFAKVCGPTHT